MFLFLDKIDRMIRGDSVFICYRYFRISGISVYLLFSGLAKYLSAWIHRLTSYAPYNLHISMISLSFLRLI
jgi:hypothetical protein